MNEDDLIAILQELKFASMADPMAAMDKYQIPFVGDQHNEIETNFLRHIVQQFFSIEVDHESLIKMVPSVCEKLGMKIEPRTLVDDPDRKICDYLIKLF